MSIKILNEGFEKIFSSAKQNKELKEAYDPALKELSSVLLDLSKRIKNGKINCNLKSCADAFQNMIENMYPDKSWWEVTDVNIQNDLFDTQDPEKTALNIIKNIREKSDRKIEALKESEIVKPKKRKPKKAVKESLRRKRLSEDEAIKRYSDHVPQEKRKYWYFTTHGVQPGSIPKDLHVLEVRDGENERGTQGTFVMLDGVLNTSELRKYDMRELAPKEETERKRIRPQGERITAWESLKNKKKNSLLAEKGLTRAERHNRNMDRIFNNKKEQDKKFANFLKKNGYSEENIEKLRKQDKLGFEIYTKFGGSDTLGKILGESSNKRKSKRTLKEDYITDLVAEILSGKVKKPSHKVFKWKSNNGDSGEVTYRGIDYAFRKLPNGDYKVMRSSDAGWNWSETLFKESKLMENKKLNESFDDMQVFMNTWANYNENGADSGITPTGWMGIDDAIEYCEEYADYEPFINDTDNVPFDDINEYSNASSVLQELKELQESDVDEDVVAAIIEAGGYDIKEAIEIAESGDYFWYPGLSSYTDLAYAVIDELGSPGEALGKRVANYIDEDQMRREYRWDIREIMRGTAEQEVDDAHEGEDEDSYDREQEIEDWMDEHEDEYLDMIIDEDIRMAEAGEIDLSNYFDYEAFGRDLSFDGYTIVSGGIIRID